MGSFSSETVKDLLELNKHRGSFSWSITCNNNTEKDFGEFDTTVLENTNKGYKMCHIQAPTNGLVYDKDRIHPTLVQDSKLWHNGLLRPAGIRYLNNKLGTDESFDTLLLHKAVVEYGFGILSEIEGLFSCVLYLNGNYYIFRTKHGKLFVDDNLSISSERFDDSKCINYDTIYKIDFENNTLEPVDTFRTKRFNIVVKGEL